MADDLLTGAEALAPELTARSAEIETARRVPADLSRKMARAGFYRMFVPEFLGGLEVSPATGVRVFERLARADASCAWVAFIGATSGTVLVRLPEASARAVFATPETLITGVFAPNGRAEVVDGGFTVNGRWQWGSGSQNADWILGGCGLYRDGQALTTRSGVPRSHMMLFAARDVQFLDTWHVSGLRGTGSTDYVVEDLHVPDDHAVGYLVTANPERPLYQFPQFTFLALGIAGVALGIARAAIDELIALASGKMRAGTSSAIANRPYTQMQVAEAEAKRCAADRSRSTNVATSGSRPLTRCRRRSKSSMRCTRWPAALPCTSLRACSVNSATSTSPPSTSWWHRAPTRRWGVCSSVSRRTPRHCESTGRGGVLGTTARRARLTPRCPAAGRRHPAAHSESARCSPRSHAESWRPGRRGSSRWYWRC